MPTATDKAIAEIRVSNAFSKTEKKQLLELIRPHIRFEPRKGKAADDKPGATRFGGDPDLPEGIAWPIGPGHDGEAPMDFLAQIDLDTVARRDVDDLLPKTGVLAFFVSQSYEGGAVIHGDHGELVRVPTPGRKKSAKPPKPDGFDVSADMVLAPPWTQFVSSSSRTATMYNTRTGKTGKGPTLVELAPQAHAHYSEIYDRWLEEVGHHQHGMFGYERAMEGVQTEDELALLRLDYNEFGTYDFVEVVSIYWFITKDALIARKFEAVEVHCGSTI